VGCLRGGGGAGARGPGTSFLGVYPTPGGGGGEAGTQSVCYVTLGIFIGVGVVVAGSLSPQDGEGAVGFWPCLRA
jgi:hypothetical protein